MLRSLLEDMGSMPISRRSFCASAALLSLARHLPAQGTRVDVAATERVHILAEADAALKLPIRTLTSYASPGKEPHTFYSEAPPFGEPKAFRAHADALTDASAAIAALTAAYVVTKEEKYALRAGNHLYAWFVDPATSMLPSLESVYSTAAAAIEKARGLADGVALAEIARALPFLLDTAALAPPDAATVRQWFISLQEWLNSSRLALIARDMRDHTASAWLLMASCVARTLGDEASLTALRHRFKAPTLRNQVQATGVFHHEVISEAPLRNSLFNFDLLAGACEMLSTPFASLWPYELEDGPGMRPVAAYLFPFLQAPGKWPYPADNFRFREVPRRRPGLLLSGRAYLRPEYVELWKTLPPMPADDPLRGTFPIRQPLLWVTRAPHENRM